MLFRERSDPLVGGGELVLLRDCCLRELDTALGFGLEVIGRAFATFINARICSLAYRQISRPCSIAEVVIATSAAFYRVISRHDTKGMHPEDLVVS